MVKVKNFIVLCLTVLLFVGCSNNTEQPNSPSNEDGIMYSNLVDSASQKTVTDILVSHGVSKEQTDTLVSWINDFNSRVTYPKLPEGFVTMGVDYVSYNDVIVEYKELDEENLAPEANCRLTSFLILKNIIQTNGKQDDKDTFLMFDIEAIDMYEQFHLSEEEKSNFISLFNWVPVSGTSTVEEHIDKIQEAWKDREIVVNNDKGLSIINVYLHDTLDDVRFVGHSGALVETEDGLVFIEKYGPAAPFQAIKISSREELKKYLLNREDLYGDESELEPIVMENNIPM